MEDVEKLETICTVDRNIKWCSHNGKQYGSSKNWKQNYHVIQQFHFWVYTHEKWDRVSNKKICTLLFMTALFKKPKGRSYLSIGRWIDKQNVLCTYNGILSSSKTGRKSDMCCSVDAPWGHHAEWTPSKKDKYCMI